MEEKVWGYIDRNKVSSFVPLTEEQLNRLLEIWGEEKEKAIFRELDIHGEFQNNSLPLDVRREKLYEVQYDAFTSTQIRFFDEFKIIPIKGTITI